MTDLELFTMANRTFDLFSLAERLMVLEAVASLGYPSIEDRFSEGVDRVIRAKATTTVREA